MQCCLRFNLNNEFPDFDCHFSLSRVSLNWNIVSRSSRLEHFFTEFMLLSGLVPIFLGPYASLLIQDPGRPHMQFLPSSSLSLNCIGRSLRLAYWSLQWIGLSTDLALDLHWGVGSCISSHVLRTLVFTHEILLKRFGLIFWSEMFLKSSKISWPVCPFLSTNSVNKSVYPRVGFQSGWREETRREAISECRPL